MGRHTFMTKQELDTHTNFKGGVSMTEKHIQEEITRCIGCNKKPSEIAEYRDIAMMEEITPLQAVLEHEGTYDTFKPNKFYCTDCYIKAGMPVRNF